MKRPRRILPIEWLGLLMLVVAAVALSPLFFDKPSVQGQTPQPRDFELIDKQDGSPFVQIKQTPRLAVLFRPESIQSIEVYAPMTAPERFPWHVVYIQLGTSRQRVDCQTPEQAESLIEFIVRNFDTNNKDRTR